MCLDLIHALVKALNLFIVPRDDLVNRHRYRGFSVRAALGAGLVRLSLRRCFFLDDHPGQYPGGNVITALCIVDTKIILSRTKIARFPDVMQQEVSVLNSRRLAYFVTPTGGVP